MPFLRAPVVRGFKGQPKDTPAWLEVLLKSSKNGLFHIQSTRSTLKLYTKIVLVWSAFGQMASAASGSLPRTPPQRAARLDTPPPYWRPPERPAHRQPESCKLPRNFGPGRDALPPNMEAPSSEKASVNGTKSSKGVLGASMLVWGRVSKFVVQDTKHL